MPNADYFKDMYGAMAEGRIEYTQRRAFNQKGSGFFGRVIRGSILPLIKSVMPYLKEVALDGVGGLVNDLKEGKSVKDATKDQFRRKTSDVITAMASKIRPKRILQTGSGLRRRRRKRSRKSKKRVKRRPARKRRQLFPV